MSDNNKNLIMGMGLIAAAFYLTTRRPTYAANPGAAYQTGNYPAGLPGRGPLGAGSMPGSVGSGLAQQIGGAIGNAIVKQFGGGTATGVKPSNSGFDFFPPMAGDGILQNSIPDADPMGTFDPGFNLTTGYEDYA
jgi:hypothetical protein